MASNLGQSDIAEIREEGVQRLGGHFSWPELSGERQRFHQQFTHDVAVFAAERGFPWSDVIRVAIMAKDVFPRLDGLDAPQLLSLLRDVLSECLPHLTSVHQQDLTQFLIDTCVARRRLLQAVVAGAANLSITRGHLEVQAPPRPLPLAQGTDLHELELQRQRAELTATLRQKEEELRIFREGSNITLGDVDAPEGGRLDKEGVLELVRAAVRASGGQMLASLGQETSLVSDILELKVQHTALATRGLHHPTPPKTIMSTLTKTQKHASRRDGTRSKN
ncbi:uncharacterized protein C8orf74 homolog [Polymixia lowei]